MLRRLFVRLGYRVPSGKVLIQASEERLEILPDVPTEFGEVFLISWVKFVPRSWRDQHSGLEFGLTKHNGGADSFVSGDCSLY